MMQDLRIAKQKGYPVKEDYMAAVAKANDEIIPEHVLGFSTESKETVNALTRYTGSLVILDIMCTACSVLCLAD